jgi:hypothetical protein
MLTLTLENANIPHETITIFFFLENKINKKCQKLKGKTQNKNSQNRPNIGLTKFQVVVCFGAVCGGALKCRLDEIERRHSDPSMMLHAACVRQAWSCHDGALKHACEVSLSTGARCVERRCGSLATSVLECTQAC